ncbi:MAG: YncE family protein, partial [Gemmatimonadota bacterium]|nr:YncE family protein [Gemmatimonadota bacterium]
MTRSPFAAVTRVEGIRAGALALALLMAGCATTPRPARSQEYLYVASQEDVTVSVIDMDARALVATVDLKELGYSPTAKAHHVAVEPDGSFWYVSLIADGKVLKFDRSNRLVGQVDFETPGMLALDPGSDLLYVGRSMAAVNPPRRVGIVRRSTMEMEEIDVFFPRPHALAVDPVRGRFYTASLGENSVAYAPLGEEEVDLLRVEAHHHHMFVQFAVSPDGRWMVTGGEMSGDLVVFDVSGDAPVAARTLHLGDKPWHPVFSPDGKELYV